MDECASQGAPKFHVFPAYVSAWPDVQPGDVVVSPGSMFYRLFDFIGRDENTSVIVTRRRPMLVLARIDGSIDGERLEPHCSTFIVFSISRGFLVTVMPREEKR